MWIEFYLKCKHFSVHCDKEQEKTQHWNFLCKDDDILMIVLNQYHPYILIEFKTNQTRFVFETLEEAKKVYKAIKMVLKGEPTEIDGIGYIRPMLDTMDSLQNEVKKALECLDEISA